MEVIAGARSQTADELRTALVGLNPQELEERLRETTSQERDARLAAANHGIDLVFQVRTRDRLRLVSLLHQHGHESWVRQAARAAKFYRGSTFNLGDVAQQWAAVLLKLNVVGALIADALQSLHSLPCCSERALFPGSFVAKRRQQTLTFICMPLISSSSCSRVSAWLRAACARRFTVSFACTTRRCLTQTHSRW